MFPLFPNIAWNEFIARIYALEAAMSVIHTLYAWQNIFSFSKYLFPVLFYITKDFGSKLKSSGNVFFAITCTAFTLININSLMTEVVPQEYMKCPFRFVLVTDMSRVLSASSKSFPGIYSAVKFPTLEKHLLSTSAFLQ